MLKFFRRIRRQLLDEVQLRKYLVYAIGEILLVMIGILLALQVNNWNEDRKLREAEINILRDLNNDLEIKIKELQEVYSFNKEKFRNLINFIRIYQIHPYATQDVSEYMGLGDYWPVDAQVNSLEAALERNTISTFKSDSLVILLRNLKSNLVKLETDTRYLDESWIGSIVPFYVESGLSVYYYDLANEGQAPHPETIEKIDNEKLVNQLAYHGAIQKLWLDKHDAIIENMKKIRRKIQEELKR